MSDELYTVADATAVSEGDDIEPSRARLLVYLGSDNPSGTRAFELPRGAEIVFGRSRGSTVHIDSERVSRTHARLVHQGGEIVIEDLGSRNGTRVDGTRIERPTRLRSGDEITIGPVTAVLSVTSRFVPQTPIGSTSFLEQRLAAEVDRGLRFQRRFALIMMRLDGDAPDCDQAVASVASQLRVMDVIAEYGPDDLAILLPEADEHSAGQAAGRLLEAARSTGVKTRLGLACFPTHGTQAGVLVSLSRAALRRAQTEGSDRVVVPPAEASPADSEIIIGDPQTERVYALVRKVADHPITVLVNGETGVGKELVAEAVHRASRRRDEPFVRLNCASIPETLLESELFGHEKGAFTGADRRKRGYFEAAAGGTIFLDEIGEIKEAVQSKLLRVLEEHKITRVGGTEEICVDARVVCATNRDLEAEVASGRFREDLYFRISAFTILVPPLRDRPGEIPLLARHFLRRSAIEAGVPSPSLSPAADAVLAAYHWPGNVRELRNAIERALVLHAGGVVEIDDLPDRLRRAVPASRSILSDPSASGDMRDQLSDIERTTIAQALEACGGNQTRTAKKLGISRRALIYKLEKHGLKPPPGSKR